MVEVSLALRRRRLIFLRVVSMVSFLFFTGVIGYIGAHVLSITVKAVPPVKEEVVQAPVMGFAVNQDDKYARVKISEGIEVLLESNLVKNAKEITLYKAHLNESTRTGTQWIYRDDNVYYSLDKIKVKPVEAGELKALPVELIIIAAAIFLSVLSSDLLERSFTKRMPALRARKFKGYYGDTGHSKTLTFIFGYTAPMVVGFSVIELISYRFLRIVGMNNGTVSVVDSVLASLFVAGVVCSAIWLMCSNNSFHSAIRFLSSRIMWGRAENLPCKVFDLVGLKVSERDRKGAIYPEASWPIPWIVRKNPDWEVFDALGGFAYEGTLKDLLSATKVL